MGPGLSIMGGMRKGKGMIMQKYKSERLGMSTQVGKGVGRTC